MTQCKPGIITLSPGKRNNNKNMDDSNLRRYSMDAYICFLNSYLSPLLSCFCFIVDVNIKWDKFEDELNVFIQHVNNVNPLITFIYEISASHITCLVNTTQVKKGIISMELSCKPETNTSFSIVVIHNTLLKALSIATVSEANTNKGFFRANGIC